MLLLLLLLYYWPAASVAVADADAVLDHLSLATQREQQSL
jgi:hypothetical protein